jgi:hypothetical protein
MKLKTSKLRYWTNKRKEAIHHTLNPESDALTLLDENEVSSLRIKTKSILIDYQSQAMLSAAKYLK